MLLAFSMSLSVFFAEQSPTERCYAFHSWIDRRTQRTKVVVKTHSKKMKSRKAPRKSSSHDVKKSVCSDIVQDFKKFVDDCVAMTGAEFNRNCQQYQKEALQSLEEIVRKTGEDRDRELDEANRAMDDAVRTFRDNLTKKVQDQEEDARKYAASLRDETKKRIRDIMAEGTKKVQKKLKETKTNMAQERQRLLKSKSAEFKKQFNEVLGEIKDQRQQIVNLGIKSALLEVTRRFEENASDEHVRSLLHVARDEFLTKARAVVDQSIDDSFVDNCNSVASQAAGLDPQQKRLALSNFEGEKAIAEAQVVETEMTNQALANLQTTREQALGMLCSPSPKFVNMTNHLHLFSSCI